MFEKKFSSKLISRRSVIKSFGIFTALATVPSGLILANDKKEITISDADIFNFALNLESLEAEYYLRGTTGQGLNSSDAGDNPGTVTGGRMVPWVNTELKQMMEEVAQNELAHVRFYRKLLGKAAISRPTINITGGFAGAGRAAGLGEFDPFESEMNFFLGGMLMEDVGVTAYKGAAPLIENKKFLEAAAGILACESYHMGMVRSTLYRMGDAARKAANAISDARDSLDGSEDLDQGIEVDGKANIVSTDSDAICFSRTPQQVLRIVYGTDKVGVSQGGMYPDGMNGAIKTT